jgi:hypothetical protein
VILNKLPKPEAVVALVGEQGWLTRLRQIRQNVAQDRQRFEGVRQGEKP